MKKILVGMDFNPEFDGVLDYAKNFCKKFNAELYIVHSESVDFYINSVVSETGIQPSLEIIEERKRFIKKKLNELEENLKNEGIKSQCYLLDGPSAKNILEKSEEISADMIVLGTHKHGRFYNLLMGTTHDQIINKSKIPVLIVPS